VKTGAAGSIVSTCHDHEVARLTFPAPSRASTRNVFLPWPTLEYDFALEHVANAAPSRLQRNVAPAAPVNANVAVVVVVQAGGCGGPDVIVGADGGAVPIVGGVSGADPVAPDADPSARNLPKSATAVPKTRSSTRRRALVLRLVFLIRRVTSSPRCVRMVGRETRWKGAPHPPLHLATGRFV